MDVRTSGWLRRSIKFVQLYDSIHKNDKWKETFLDLRLQISHGM